MAVGHLILKIKDLSNRMEKQAGTNKSEKQYHVSEVADVSQDGVVVNNLPCMY
jgi:hypothetical protein